MDRDERFRAEALPHFKSLHATALRLTRNAHEAEDLVQETFLRAFRGFDRFLSGTNVRAWLYTILHRVRADSFRQSARAPQAGELQGDGPPMAPIQHQLGASLDLERALGQVPEVFREALVLRDIEEMSYDEIARALEIPIGTVMSRIHRGRALLRQALGGVKR